MSNIQIQQYNGSSYDNLVPKESINADTLDGYHASSFLTENSIISPYALDCYFYQLTTASFQTQIVQNTSNVSIYATKNNFCSGTILSISRTIGEKINYSSTDLFNCTIKVKIKECYRLTSDGQKYSNLQAGDVCFGSSHSYNYGDEVNCYVGTDITNGAMTPLYSFNNIEGDAWIWGNWRSSDQVYRVHLNSTSTYSSSIILPSFQVSISEVGKNFYSSKQLPFSAKNNVWINNNQYCTGQNYLPNVLLN